MWNENLSHSNGKQENKTIQKKRINFKMNRYELPLTR